MLISKSLKLAKPFMVNTHAEHRIYAMWFLGVFLIYLSFSPMAIAGSGYMFENMQAAEQITSRLISWFSGNQAPAPINWPRHGAVEMIFEVPFILAARLAFGTNPFWADRVMSLQPILLAALLSTVILKWVRNVTGSLKWGFAVALMAAFTTMLWPYAYIGLETTQSLFLLLSGYLALNYDRSPTWPRTLALGIAAGIAVSAKSNGVFLLPAIGFLFLCYFWRDWHNPSACLQALKQNRMKALCLVSITAGLYWLGSYTRSIYWSQHGSLMRYVTEQVMVDSPATTLMNLWSQIFSINKGLIFFAPIAVVGLFAGRRAYRVDPRLAIFAWLVLAGMAGSLSLLFPWQDEVWGPRYLHTAVAPLIICLAAALRGTSFSLKRHWWLWMPAVLGLTVSFLGSIFYYGSLHRAANVTGSSTLENLLNDPRLNHPNFNLKLLRNWLLSTDEQWPPPERWWFENPPNVPAMPTVHLRDYAEPQSVLLHPSQSPRLAMCLGAALITGLGCLSLAWLLTRRFRE